MTLAASPVGGDGRTARRDRNRVAVLDAVIALFGEGHLQPRPEEVAERSGVSLRSVYRYYSDPAELLRAAMRRRHEVVAPLLEIAGLGEGAFEDRVERFVKARMKLYDVIAPTARAARLAGARNPVLREQYERQTLIMRQQMERHFAPELAAMEPNARRAVAVAVDALFQLEVGDYYRLQRRLSSRQATDLLILTVTRLLGP